MKLLKEDKVVRFQLELSYEELETIVRAMGSVSFGYPLFTELDNVLKGDK
jgi:hypothetical protein